MVNWLRAKCPECGRTYRYMAGDKPATCGQFECIHRKAVRDSANGAKRQSHILLKYQEDAGMYVDTVGDKVYLMQYGEDRDVVINTFTTGATIEDIRYTARKHLEWQLEDRVFGLAPAMQDNKSKES